MTINKHSMKTELKSLIISIITGITYYILDAVLDYILFYEELKFIQVFITDPPIHEVYSRILGMATIIILGMILTAQLLKGESYLPVGTGDQLLSSDPNLMVNVSNQIKTPLNAIMGFVELLRDPGLSDVSKELYVNHIRTSVKYLVELTDNVTDITKIETGTLYLNNEHCQLNVMLKQLYEHYLKVIREKDKPDLAILLKTSMKDESYTIQTDETRLRQVLGNLVENSISLTDEGTIEFGYNLINQDILDFFVKDTGAGLSPGRLETVFEQFKKVSDARMRPFDIVALRISISKHLVKLLGSDLKADSQLGKGSDFRFRLKVSTVSKEDETEVPPFEHEIVAKDDKGMKWKGKQILIAEDVESNFIYLQEILKPTGAKILWAENGLQAIKICRTKKEIDIVLMDILMPEMDGYEAAKVIREENPELPIIAQTAYHLDEAEYKGAMNYFNKFLIKPIWSHDLKSSLSVFLG
jgi:signal transduction histidine kinase